MSAQLAVLLLFLWCVLMAFIIPYTEGAQGAWLLLATVVLGCYTCIKVSDLYTEGGKL